MNLFRLCGDMFHLLSIMVLLLKIRATRSCRGEQLAVGDDRGTPRRIGRPPEQESLLPSVDWRSAAHRIAAPLHAGISLKTQELYALVFVCRYLDLFYSFISV